MANIIEGKLTAEGLKVGIVVARFNEFITSKLLGGALDGLKRHGADDADIDVVWVPGAYEIPMLAQKMATSKKYDAVIWKPNFLGAAPVAITTLRVLYSALLVLTVFIF